ncbi:NADH-quinone oxidoreductase subunit C [Campylobacter sp. RM9344]|uniref:NADH-quinone oxidoreductase subunit C n=1 Tax=Campylobacter californiensis TaxID=1032243 RepID=A0AAW3ZU05_9BACT|nr:MULTISPECIES: NADH-quinone oxidoreductase subunit C [unclassified Campylobacter]MBE2984482.1 NADH-quinone oxidoreductase subunit C [Campylobacter sp. RM6883]MBE2994988.1 NADH-quinone oxidoreductase subunit C [Campylobacter sp. RM6913]MBE3028923.1 NADH-quinone oxidoreductase subunit C [Campylobacter sp. RM9344]MBE3607281.1 NADH-quinone oxidoreductase subunit C [Campylobacter sp. RM9337]QCD50176.1 hydrogenase-4, component G [Campylobacter sp. RM6914]
MRGDKFIEILRTKVKVLEVTHQADDQVTVLVDRNDLPLAVKTLYYDIGGFLSTMIPNDEREINGNFALYYAISMEGGKMSEDDDFAAQDKCFITVKTLIPASDPTFPSVTPHVPACVWYEREAFDMFGLRAEGLPDKRRLVLADDWPDGLHPLRKDAMDYRYRPDPVAHQDEPDAAFLFPSGDSVVDVPLGPLHVASDEPGHFRLFCDGDEIIDADYRLFYQHRGMEKLAENRMNYDQMGYLAERVCGICGYAHAIACIEAAEKAINLEIPLRAQAIRVVCLEIERLHSHLLNIGLACEVTGNYNAFMHIFRVREYSMELAQLVTGGRKTYGNVIMGGLRRDMTNNEIKKSIEIINNLEVQIDEIWDAVMEDKRQIERWKGVGILDRQIARDFSPVGPNMRASGFKRDNRYDHPYDFFKQLEFKVAVEHGCDVFSREMVRYKELKESISIIRQCFELMPQTPIMIDPKTMIRPENFALGHDEAPRGENVHWIMQGSAQKVYRWRCRAATYNNWPSLRYQFRGNNIADAALIVCSLDPCYSCTERVTLVDVRSKKSKILTEKDLKKFCQIGGVSKKDLR